jgi:hypothetical protein
MEFLNSDEGPIQTITLAEAAGKFSAKRISDIPNTSYKEFLQYTFHAYTNPFNH